MSPLLKRILSGFIYVAIFVSSIVYSKETFLGLVTLFGLIAIFEFHKIIQFKNSIPYFLLPIVAYFAVFYLSDEQLLWLLIITLLSSVLMIYQLYAHKSSQPTRFLDKMAVSIRYIILPFVFLMLVPFINQKYNPQIIIGILVLIWVNDSFAFLVGKNFGKRKLFKSVSPKKTIEGFAGGVLFSMIASYMIAISTDSFLFSHWLVIAVIVSVLGTVGDLVESKFKRQAKIKDSGTIMPGHGGILDRLDSLYFVSPFVYLYIHFIM